MPFVTKPAHSPTACSGLSNNISYLFLVKSSLSLKSRSERSWLKIHFCAAGNVSCTVCNTVDTLYAHSVSLRALLPVRMHATHWSALVSEKRWQLGGRRKPFSHSSSPLLVDPTAWRFKVQNGARCTDAESLQRVL